MKKRTPLRRSPPRRNPIARVLRSPAFKKRVVASRRAYSRKTRIDPVEQE
ncbi:MAG TPA: hypothetical protein VKI44_03560 [Acetobacteraceae bacterium]|nr:hypothetical protein [Acetobacteraceae bacterium]